MAEKDVQVLSSLIEQGWDTVLASFNIGEDALFVLGRKVPWWRRWFPSVKPIRFPEQEGKILWKS